MVAAAGLVTPRAPFSSQPGGGVGGYAADFSPAAPYLSGFQFGRGGDTGLDHVDRAAPTTPGDQDRDRRSQRLNGRPAVSPALRAAPQPGRRAREIEASHHPAARLRHRHPQPVQLLLGSRHDHSPVYLLPILMAAPLTVITTRAAPPAPETRPRRATRLTTSVSQRAKIALLLFVALVLALQALSVPVAYYAMHRLVEWVPDFSGIGTHAQWSAYLARPRAPDVLFVGDSQAFTDVDTEAISGLVSSRLGRQVAVGKLGVSGEGPDFLNALIYRVMNRPSHPRLVLLELSQATLNEFRGFDPSADLWQISEPFDPGFMARAYRVDPHRGRLARAWVLPFS